MRHLFSIVLLTCSVSISFAADSSITIRPVQFIAQAEIPDGAPRNAKTIGFNTGFTIGYLVEGADIIGFNQQSLKIDHILMGDNKDIATKRNGKPNFKLGSFPVASDDGKFGFFTVESEEHVFGKLDSISVKGSIVVRTATRLKSIVSKPHVLGSGDEEKQADFTVNFGVVRQKEKMPRFIEEDFKKKNVVTITGSLGKIIEVNLKSGDAEIKAEGYTSSEDGPRSYFFEKGDGAAPSAVLTIKYWEDLKAVEVPFGK